MNHVLVIGGTGAIGREVVSQLAARGGRVRVMTRNPNATDLGHPRIEVMQGDLTLPGTLEGCLEGIDTVFLVWTAPPAAVAPALQRIAKEGRRVVYLSAPLKTPHPFFQQPNPARTLAERIESLIEDSGVPFTFVRPGMFARNALLWWAETIRAGKVVRWPYLEVPTAPIHERDIAAVAVRALTGDGDAAAEYVITGPESLTQGQQLSILGHATGLGTATGQSFGVEEISPDEARRELLALMPARVIDMLLDAWAAAMGQAAFVSSTVAEVTGAPARSFEEWARDHAAEFAP